MRKQPSVLGVLAATLSLVAIATDRGTAQSFSDVVDVRVVNVDVWVSDKNGRAIEGLTAADFILYEDGVEVPISNFFAFDSPDPQLPTASRREPAAGEELPLLPIGEAETIHAVLHLDGNTLGLADRSALIEDLRTFAVDNVGADVKFALASAVGGAKMETPFTSDPGRILRALDRLAQTAPPSQDQVREYRNAITTLHRLLEIEAGPGTTCPDDGCRTCSEIIWPTLVQAWEAYAVSSSVRVRTAVSNLGEIVSSLGGIPGRKALFFVSSGLQQRPGLDLLLYLGELCQNYQREAQTLIWRFDETSTLEELTARANANRVTLVALDAGRLRSSDSAATAYESIYVRPSALVSNVRLSNLQNSLFVLADQTGGRAIFNANQPLADLGRLLEEQRRGYSLGLALNRPPDGESHRLKVELRNKPRGVSVRYRQSYRDKPESEKLGDRMMASLRLGVEENPLAVQASVGPAREVGRKRYEVPLILRIPTENLIFESGGGSPASVKIFLAAEDAAGRRTAIKEQSIEVDARQADETGAVHELVVEIELREGPHRVGIGIRDEVGGTTSLLALDLEVPPPGAVAAGRTD